MSVKKYKKVKIVLAAILLITLIIFSLHGANINAQSSSVVEAFSTSTPLQDGTIVQLKNHSSTTVVQLTQSNISQMYGVVVSPNNSPLTLSNSTAATTQTYVATTGTYNVLVTNQNGSISSGDYITISAVDGIGMKADNSQSLVLGKALGSFNGSNSLGTVNLKSTTGGNIPVKIGSVEVAINVIHNPLATSSSADLPSFLGKAANSITSKQVSSAKLYLSLFVIVIATILSGGLMYAGVRSSIIAIGRNPLSKKSVLRGLFQVTLIALSIFILGLFGVYLLLIL